MIINLVLFIFSFLLSNILIKRFISQFSKKFLDIPNNRSMHENPIPRGLGIVFVTLTISSSLIYIFFNGFSKELMIPIVCVPLAIIGFIDDLKDLSPKIKYFFQVLTSILIILLSSNLSFGFEFDFKNLLVIGLIIFISTGIINFINFMDGIDGLISVCMLISILTCCIELGFYQSYIVLLGSLFSFIIWNWNPAKIFMGDTGSTFLAAINIGLIFQADTFFESFKLLLILTPCLIDPFVCIVRRFFVGQNIFTPHRSHLYQRLRLSGISTSKISLLYISTTFLLATTVINLDIKFSYLIILFILFIGFYLDQYVAQPFDNKLRKS